jgi:ribonuclease Y
VVIYVLLGIGIGLIIGLMAGYFLRKNSSEKKIGSAETLAQNIINDANRTAEANKREILLEAKDEIFRLRTEQERENKERRNEVARLEKRVLSKEESLDKKFNSLERKEDQLQQRTNAIASVEEEIESLYQEQKNELQRIAELTRDEAKELLLDEVRNEIEHEQAQIIRNADAKMRDESEKRAREIISTAIQRYAADHVTESTVTVVTLPNEEMKGRIIGREGRNIRALETMTGIDLIIDDTPEAVVLSSFDPIRREVARIALEKLITDGRIHPARIEEMVGKAQLELESIVREAGEQACDDANVHGLHPELVKTLGRLKYRTSYGQNVLKHAVEVSNLAGMMAADLGADVNIAKRAGLLHDLGKAIDHEVEGPHVELGVNLAKKFRENKEVLHAIEAHHGDVDTTTIEAVLVQAADAISAARPGARRETLENYIHRLENLEGIANRFEGIEKSFAIQAGRELRIMVKPDRISEDQMVITAREIAKAIENELQYPGQIKVHVIRETRTTDYAK